LFFKSPRRSKRIGESGKKITLALWSEHVFAHFSQGFPRAIARLSIESRLVMSNIRTELLSAVQSVLKL
jgi:hypothetical protein